MHYAITLLLLLLSCACVRQGSVPEISNLPKAVRSIAILPVGVMSESEAQQPSPQDVKAMDQGVGVLEQILTETFADNSKVRILSDDEVSVHSSSYNASPVVQALQIGRAVGAEAVMLWGLERYSERSGGDYSVQKPSSVAFQYRLIHVQSGQTLCAASFKETQKSASDNLLAFGTSAKRGFKWVPASVLLREGVGKKIAECVYLKVSQNQENESYPPGDKAADDGAPSSEQTADSSPESTAWPDIEEPLPPEVVPAPAAPVPPSPKETPPLVGDLAPEVKIEEISQFLEQWSKAWEAAAGPQGDMDHFGAFYAPDFTNNRQSRTSWLAEKTKKNRGKEWIRLKVSDVTIEKDKNNPLLEVRFTQEYTSSNYSDTSSKVLVLRKNGSNWEIVTERLWTNTM